MYRIVKAATGDGLGHAPVRSRVGVGYRMLASVKESKNSGLSKSTMAKSMRIIPIEGELFPFRSTFYRFRSFNPLSLCFHFFGLINENLLMPIVAELILNLFQYRRIMAKRMRIISIEGELLRNKMYIHSKNAKGK